MTPKLTKWVARPALTATTAAVICAGLLGLGAAPAGAATVDELTQQIEQTNESYESASKLVEEIEAKIAANEERIAQIEAELPEKRAAAGECMKVQYKLQQGTSGLIELLLSAENFNELISTIQYLDIINSHNNNAIDELVSLDEELAQTRLSLETERQQAEASKQEAAESLTAAVSARQALEQQMAEQAAAEQAQRQAAVAAAAAAVQNTQAESSSDSSESASESASDSGSNSGSNFDTNSGGSSEITVPDNADPGTVDWSSDKATFVSSWGARIDAYLSGSPLAGYGSVFAEAAWDYGCDPRFSPAISCIESGKGRYCFKSHNAWGWGSVSWDSWETAIRAHTKGLASIYGGHLTYDGAQMYCPPNADFWYSSVAAQMELI